MGLTDCSPAGPVAGLEAKQLDTAGQTLGAFEDLVGDGEATRASADDGDARFHSMPRSPAAASAKRPRHSDGFPAKYGGRNSAGPVERTAGRRGREDAGREAGSAPPDGARRSVWLRGAIRRRSRADQSASNAFAIVDSCMNDVPS